MTSSSQKQSRVLSFHYLLHFLSSGLYIPFFPLFYERAGFSSSQIALLHSLSSLCLCFVPVLLGYYIAHRNLPMKKTYTIVVVLSFLTSIAFAIPEAGFLLFFFVALSHALCRVCVNPLLDSLALNFSSETGKPYGHLRLWGSVGFMLTCLVGGIMIDYSPLFFALAHSAFYLFQIPACSMIDSSENSAGTVMKFQFQEYSRHLPFYFIAFFLTLSHGPYYVFFTIFLEKEVQIEPVWFGAFWVFGVLSETLMMRKYRSFFSGFDLKGGIKRCASILKVCLLFTALRWLALAFLRDPVLLFLTQSLHAFSYGAYHLACMDYLEVNFSPSQRPLAVSLYISTSFGLGGLFGMNLSGQLLDLMGYQNLFLACSLIALLTILLPAFFQEEKTSSCPS